MSFVSVEKYELAKNKLRKCSKCKIIKQFSEFGIDRNDKLGINHYCKKCKRSFDKKYNDSVSNKKMLSRLKTKMELVNLLGGMCQRCKYNECVNSLDFHHVNSDNKKYTPAIILTNKCNSLIAYKEIDKCCLLCSNCHRSLGTTWDCKFVKSQFGYRISRVEELIV